MKVIILAGGFGTRLSEYTNTIPKPMIQLGSRPLIWHIMKYFSHYDFKDFIVSAGVKSHILKEYFLNYEAYTSDFIRDYATDEIHYLNGSLDIDWRVAVVDTGLNTQKGARIKRVEKMLTDDVNMVTYGDGLSDIDLQKLNEFHSGHGKTITISGVHPPARFGEITETQGVVQEFSEKPQTSSGLINGGFMVFNKDFLKRLSEDESCDLETDVLPRMAKEKEVMVYKHDGHWDCIDHERDLIHLNQLWSESRAFWKLW